jgi:protein-disulfide isomerase
VLKRSSSTHAAAPRATWWLGATIALLVGALAVMLLPLGSASPSVPTGDIPPIGEADISQGGHDAKVTFIEYGDFQCSTCARYAPIVTELRTNYQDRVLFAYRFVPLLGTNAPIAAQAAFAADLQGKFWPMYELLYEKRSDWQDSSAPLDIFAGYAQSLGLQTSLFMRDATAESTVQSVLEQRSQAVGDGISELPSFFINGRPVYSDTYEGFAEALDEVLADVR